MPSSTPTEMRFFRELFLQKLPIIIRTALATHKDATLNQLAEMADDMAEVQGPQPPVYLGSE